MVMRPHNEEDYVEAERGADVLRSHVHADNDASRAEVIRADLIGRLRTLIEQLNALKRDNGLNVEFVLIKGQDGMFQPDPQIRITKDL